MNSEHAHISNEGDSPTDWAEGNDLSKFAQEKHVRILNPENKDDQRLLDRKSDEFFMNHAPESFSDEIADDVRSLQ